MILAGIDIGTNTLRLLVAEINDTAFRELYSDRKITRLGRNLERAGSLSRDAEERSLAVLAEFAGKARRYSAFRTAAAGTSALRKAANAGEFVREARQRAGIDITIIRGEEEARLTLLGVGRVLGEPGKPGGRGPGSMLVIDIGGGSTEAIVTRPDSSPTMQSLHLGAVYLTERFLKHDPPSGEELDMLHQAVREELVKMDESVRSPRPGVCAGTAGTITTLAAMDQGLAEYDPDKINHYVLTREAVGRIIRRLSVSTLEQRRAVAGLEPGREDIILAGAVVAREIMERYDYAELLVSDWGLREGIVIDLYEKIKRDEGRETKDD